MTVPWWTRKTPSLPTYGSCVTLNTCASTCCAGSAARRAAAARRRLRLSGTAGGLPSVGFGSSRANTSSSSATPAPLRAETKQIGIRWPSRSACSNGACSSLRVDVALVQVALDEVRHRPRRPARPARGAPASTRREVRLRAPSGVEEAVDHLRAAVGRQVERQAFACRTRPGSAAEQRRQVDALRVDLVDDDHAVEVALRAPTPSCARSSSRCRSAALTTTAAVSTAASAVIDWPRKSG